ncbi:cadherin-like and PC-esterase domain-containing protein 1 [Genypterus blacodes]|uniref:cadherin-like and PC-esterase domain-containing protein 1 n=1 Tax=Genypterus blacodes TaxID=154954 RepID=UPI003F77565B
MVCLVCVRDARMLLRRRSCSGPLVLLGVAVCLFYQTRMGARNHLKSGQEPADREPEPFVSELETLQRQTELQQSDLKLRVVVLTGRHVVSSTEVQMYQRVLEQKGYEVQLSRYAETSALLRPDKGGSKWNLLVCLSSSERSCLRRISSSRLQPHQRVNMVPWLVEAFSDSGSGLCRFYTHTHMSGVTVSMKQDACRSTRHHLQVLPDSAGLSRQSAAPSTPPALVAMVNVYVLVTSVRPLTSFLHEIVVVRTSDDLKGRPVKIRTFLLQRLGQEASHEALGHVKKVIGQVLRASVSSEEADSLHRCLLCFQLMTFTLQFDGSLLPVIVKVDTDLTFMELKDMAFDAQITREVILEDTLNFLLPSHSGLDSQTHKYGGCRGTQALCLSEDETLLLLQFHRQMKTPGAFQLLYPCAASQQSSSSSSSSSAAEGSDLSALLLRLSSFYEEQRNHGDRVAEEEAEASHRRHTGREPCVDPHLRQIYTDPPLTLTPPFSPWVKEYRAELPFDLVMVRIRPEPVSPACRVHLDEHRGPRMANYPVGLGNSRISILVADEAAPEPVVMTIYTVHMYRESRPSLPMFGDHVMCSFVQDCGLLVRPSQPCGLQSVLESGPSAEPCPSGDVPGQWVVPCLSCADNRTCDWREVAWQPEGCYHPLLDRPKLQDCMMDRKLLFIGDSTNRGMMYFLMERVNSSLEAWGKAHDTLTFTDLNQGRTQVRYSYYPQFWLQKHLRPTFQQALQELLTRSRPLANSNQTVLVVGGVQWLNTNHLRVIRDVLKSEALSEVLVVLKSLGLGFHLPVDGVRSLSLREIQDLYRENQKIVAAAKQLGYEVVDTFSITVGRYKEFLQGRCACHFHEVEKSWSSEVEPPQGKQAAQQTAFSKAPPGLRPLSAPHGSTYHVRGPVNQVYSEILLSRLCPAHTRH